ncbi:hypothetical protein A3731_08410 [Roseovarius sp. HI0049]|nr:hypothetical protein A3731_08410 [Roseovarius sp. HI0049]
MVRFALSFFLALMLSVPASAQEGGRTISGQLIYLQRIALPEGAEVVVEVKGALDATLGESRFTTDGSQVPLPFEVEVPGGLSGTLTAVVRVEDEPMWLAKGIRIGAGAEDIDLGDVRLRQYTPLAFTSYFSCGETSVEFGLVDDTPTLRVGGQDYAMEEAPADEGSRFVAKSDPEVTFWSQGTEATLTLGSEPEAGCAKVEHTPEPYTAVGNEPGWYVTIGEAEAELVADYGDLQLTTPRPEVEVETGAYVLNMPDIEARLRLEEEICHDDATGMPYPHRAALALDGQEMRGCGGDAASLLTGAEWQIEDVGEMGIIDGSNITIGFDADGRVSGRTGCNRFSGIYMLDGEGLGFGQMGVTMMGCPEAMMTQEQRLLDALQHVVRFDIDETGALLLIGPAGETLLLARRTV